MAIKHYKGELGEFNYNDKEFELITNKGEYLHYIGNETDGSKIKIPDGIIDCWHMFWNCKSLEIPPVIPDSVTSCVRMFYGCKSLRTSPVIPDGVTSCDGMFCGCKSLKIAPVIPDGVEDCRSMFCNCESLETPPVIPDCIRDCSNMFRDCLYNVEIAGEWNIEHRSKDYYVDGPGNENKFKITDSRILKAMMDGERVLENGRMQFSQKGLGE